MNSRLLSRPMIVLIFFLAAIGTGHCNSASDLVEKRPAGSIDWTRGWIRADGIRTPTEKSLGSPMDRLEMLAAAKDTARENLLAVIRQIRVDSGHTIGHLHGHDKEIMAQIREIASEAPVISQAYLSDGTVKVTVEMLMNGGFSQLVLPDEIKQIQSIKTVSTGPDDSRKEGPGDPEPESGLSSESFTGLIVDARGLKANPTMNPRIYDEGGQEVYGSAFASREFAVQQGMVRYERDLEHAARLERVGNTPLIVRGLRTTQPEHTDIIISNADATMIRSRSEHLDFLKRCQVLIVVE